MNIRPTQRTLNSWLTCLIVISLTGCQSVYYEAMEKIGYHKRDLLISDVEKARDAQADAKEQFKSALDRFTSVLNFKGGDLQEKYDKLNAEYEESEVKAQAVHERVASVEDVSEALFTEWKTELEEYSNASLRRTSQRKLDQTQKQYSQLIKAMKRAEKKMDPVMSAFKDQVLFLKHNLNAKAIASLKNELVAVESDISSLIKEMEASIKEADSFISTMAKEE
ncbi:MAG: DNA repair ATPase [Nitrospirales bacterium]|nr:MAG: DNA repair ATPase [Nitrospirales bacterium]